MREIRSESVSGLAQVVLVALFVAALTMPIPSAAGEQIEIVGSSTVYPFTTVASERFSQSTGEPTPKVESTGTGGGMKLLCGGLGPGHPDIGNASRLIKDSEVGLCASNGISEPLEVKIGYDGIVIAQSNANESLSLTLEEIFQALARELPDASGSLHPNPNRKWSDVNPSLPDVDIRVYGPPPTSGTRDAFVEHAMEEGCKNAPGMEALKALDEEGHEATCKTIREDGAFIEAGENDNLIIQRLVSNQDSLGVLGFSYLEESLDKVSGVHVGGVEPTFEAIAEGEYPLSRPLFIYVKTEHGSSNPSVAEFVRFYVSDVAIGEDGFLIDRGLITLTDTELSEVRSRVENAF